VSAASMHAAPEAAVAATSAVSMHIFPGMASAVSMHII
jgi:hypothetical protein